MYIFGCNGKLLKWISTHIVDLRSRFYDPMVNAALTDTASKKHIKWTGVITCYLHVPFTSFNISLQFI